MQHCTMSSAISVSRSLTRISGKRPVRSASATVKTATFWNCRSASTCRSGSSADSRSVRAASIFTNPARLGSSSNALASINSSSSSGKSAICRDRKPLIAHTSIKRSSAAGCSLSKRQIRGARADRLQHAQHPLHDGRRRGRTRRLGKQSAKNHVADAGAPPRPGAGRARRAGTAPVSPRPRQFRRAGKPPLASSSAILASSESSHAAPNSSWR